MSDVGLIEKRPAVARQSLASRLRGAVGSHPRGVWLMAICNLILWTGRGMIAPFLIIFFSQIVGLRASVVGSGIAVSGLAGIGFVTLVAGVIDRRGGHPVLLTCILGVAATTLVYPWATHIAAFLLVTLLLNFAGQLYWPASDATVASLAEPDRVAEAMSILRVANAVGIGAGGLIGGVIASGGGIMQYRVLFTVSALTIVAAALLVWRAVPAVVLHSRNEHGAHGTWRDLMPDRTFMYALAVLFVLVFGFTQVQMSVPPFLREEAGIGEGTIGALFTLNTVLVVLTQIPIAAKVNRSRIGHLLAIGAALWALAFVCMLGTTTFGVPAAIAAFVAFTAGELLFMPISAVIPVRLAAVHLRGRYFSATSVIWGASYAIATFVAGIALDLPQPAVLWPAMAVLMLAGGLAALRLHTAPRLDPMAKPLSG